MKTQTAQTSVSTSHGSAVHSEPSPQSQPNKPKPLILAAALMLICMLISVAPSQGFTNPWFYTPPKATTPGAHRFRLTALGLLPDSHYPHATGLAVDINDTGQMIGFGGQWKRRLFPALPGLDQHHSFGTLPILKSYHLPTPNVRQTVSLVGISGHSEVIGFFDNFSDGAWIFIQDFPFVWRHGRLQVLSPLPGDNTATPSAVNNHGQVVGVSYEETPAVGSEVDHVVLWSGSEPQEIGDGVASAINNMGDVVGSASTSKYKTTDGFVPHATRWRNGQAIDLGTLGGLESWAMGINDKGEVIGDADTSVMTGPWRWVSHAFVWRAGHMTDLTPDLAEPSEARAINVHGQIVGKIQSGFGSDAVMWQGNCMIDLNDCLVGAEGWQLTEADKINARGQVLAQGTQLGHSYSVLLTPIRTSLYRRT